MTAMRHRLSIGIGLLVLVVSTGCGQNAVTDKAGSNVLQLKFATIDDLNPNGQTPGPGVFVRALEQLSGGRITVTVASSYEQGSVSAESDIVKAIAHDTFDGGWPTTRAFARADIHGLEAVEAPMTLTSYAAEKALVSGPASAGTAQDPDRDRRSRSRLGRGSVAASVQHSDPALDALQGWHGSDVPHLQLTSAGGDSRAPSVAIPVSASYQLSRACPDRPVEGRRDRCGAVRRSTGTGHCSRGPWAMWCCGPACPVLAFSQKRFDSLSSAEQKWVREAAAQAVQASMSFHYDENGPALTLCKQGVHFLYATPAQLTALKTAVQPVLTELADDPAAAPGLALVQCGGRRPSRPRQGRRSQHLPGRITALTVLGSGPPPQPPCRPRQGC